MFINCPICESHKSIELSNYREDYLSKCLKCSLVFSNKKPSKKELDEVYSQYNYNDLVTTDITKIKISNEAKKLFLLNKPKNVLDVGCGEALLLDQFKKSGCKTFATEYDTRLAETAIKKGHSVIANGLYPKFDNGEKMDLIIFTEVIEHITEQSKCLPYYHDLLSDDGIIYITTPNFSSLERRIFKDKWEFICYPEHLCYFTVSTLDECMRKFGFKKIYNYTQNISIAALLEYLAKTKNSIEDTNTKQDHYQKITNESKIFTFLKSQVNYFLRFTNLGMRIYAAYKKDKD